jgi:hypothetical protein
MAISSQISGQISPTLNGPIVWALIPKFDTHSLELQMVYLQVEANLLQS